MRRGETNLQVDFTFDATRSMQQFVEKEKLVPSKQEVRIYKG